MAVPSSGEVSLLKLMNELSMMRVKIIMMYHYQIYPMAPFLV